MEPVPQEAACPSKFNVDCVFRSSLFLAGDNDWLIRFSDHVPMRGKGGLHLFGYTEQVFSLTNFSGQFAEYASHVETLNRLLPATSAYAMPHELCRSQLHCKGC